MFCVLGVVLQTILDDYIYIYIVYFCVLSPTYYYLQTKPLLTWLYNSISIHKMLTRFQLNCNMGSKIENGFLVGYDVCQLLGKKIRSHLITPFMVIYSSHYNNTHIIVTNLSLHHDLSLPVLPVIPTIKAKSIISKWSNAGF